MDIQHVSLAQKADLIVVAPATANIIGKVAGGIADDMLSTTIMAANSPVLFVPAMNDKMYENPIVQENIKNLRRWAISLWSRIRAYGLRYQRKGTVPVSGENCGLCKGNFK